MYLDELQRRHCDIAGMKVKKHGEVIPKWPNISDIFRVNYYTSASNVQNNFLVSEDIYKRCIMFSYVRFAAGQELVYFPFNVQGGAPQLAKLVYNSNIQGLWQIYLQLPWFINQLITGGAPPCNHYIIMFISIKTRIHHRQGLITGVLMLMDNHMTVINIPRVAIVMSIDTTGWGPQLCSLVYKP